MLKKSIGIFGVILFFFSILFGIRIVNAQHQALVHDQKKTSYGIIADGPIPCTWTVKTPDRVLSENKSEAIVVEISNGVDEPCESTISLRAPLFNISPSKDEQKISLPSKKKGSLSWIITAQKTGSFEITVSDAITTKVYGLTVTDTFGLTSQQGKLFSIIGSIFGPMFTIPWWAEKWFQMKKKQQVNPTPKEPTL